MEDVNLAKQEQIDFLAAWPLSRLHSMTLEEYANVDNEDSFVSWLKNRTEHIGNTMRGRALKFGIYKSATVELYEKKRIASDGEYAWKRSYGNSKEEAFDQTRNIVINLANHGINNTLEEIDQIDLKDESKWKIAFFV